MTDTESLIPEAGNLDNFIKQFPIFAAAPDGLKKLRELILNLAFKGTLTSGLKYSNWLWKPLSDVMVFTNGYAFKSGDYTNDGIGIVRIGDINAEGEVTSDGMKFVPEHFIDALPEKLRVSKGDLVIAMSGATTGKLGFNKSDNVYLLNQRVGKISFNEVDEVYGYHYLSTKVQENLAKSRGMAQPNLSTKQINEIKIPLPPLEEQKRIVAKVDELMALVDKLEAQQQAQANTVLQANTASINALLNSSEGSSFDENWKRIATNFNTLYGCTLPMPKGDGRQKKHLVGLENVKALRSVIFALGLAGKLTHRNSDDEVVCDLLGRLDHQKSILVKEKKIKKQKQIDFDFSDFDLSAFPDHWEVVNLQRLITVMDAGWSPACPPEPSPSNDTWGVLKTTAVQPLQYNQETNKVLASTKEPKPQYEVHIGDILITRAGPKNRVGVSCLVEKTRPKLMISDKIIRLHLVEAGLSEQFISLCLNGGITAVHLENSKSGMAESQMNISQDKLKAAPIPLPPKEEQKRIVAKVDELMAICDKLEEQLKQAYTDAETLMQATVKSLVA